MEAVGEGRKERERERGGRGKREGRGGRRTSEGGRRGEGGEGGEGERNGGKRGGGARSAAQGHRLLKSTPRVNALTP